MLRGLTGLLILVVGVASTALATCPGDAVASDSTMLTGVFGTLAIELCVTRSGMTDTYAYTVTNLGPGKGTPTGFMVTGLGRLVTIAVAPSAGLMTSLAEIDCGTWWSWSPSFTPPITPPETPIRATGTFSISVKGPTFPAPVLAAVASSTHLEAFTILGPCACPEVAADDTLSGCSCTHGAAPVCVVTPVFVGEGSRIEVIGGPDTQHIETCDSSWVRHGFTGMVAPEGAGEFRLFINDAQVPLSQVLVCHPSEEPGVATFSLFWYVQFPPWHFPPGTHEVRGEWESFPTASYPGDLYTRTVTLVVEPCPLEAPPVPSLPDLSLSLGRIRCACQPTPQQTYECSVTVPVTVTNLGDEASAATTVALATQLGDDRSQIPQLAPGESRIATLKVVGVSYSGNPLCPLELEVEVDPYNKVPESDEENNIAHEEVCCQ